MTPIISRAFSNSFLNSSFTELNSTLTSSRPLATMPAKSSFVISFLELFFFILLLYYRCHFPQNLIHLSDLVQNASDQVIFLGFLKCYPSKIDGISFRIKADIYFPADIRGIARETEYWNSIRPAKCHIN